MFARAGDTWKSLRASGRYSQCVARGQPHATGSSSRHGEGACRYAGRRYGLRRRKGSNNRSRRQHERGAACCHNNHTSITTGGSPHSPPFPSPQRERGPNVPRKKKDRARFEDNTDLNPAPLPKPLKKSHAHADLLVAAVCAATRLTLVVLSQHEPVEMPYVCAPLHYTDVTHRMHAAFRAERPPWLAWQEPTRVEREWLSMGVGRAAASADQRAGGTRGQLGAADFCWWGARAGHKASLSPRRGPASAAVRPSLARAGKR